MQQTLLKYDEYIPEVRNEDPADLARTARVGKQDVEGQTRVREQDRGKSSHIPVTIITARKTGSLNQRL